MLCIFSSPHPRAVTQDRLDPRLPGAAWAAWKSSWPCDLARWPGWPGRGVAKSGGHVGGCKDEKGPWLGLDNNNGTTTSTFLLLASYHTPHTAHTPHHQRTLILMGCLGGRGGGARRGAGQQQASLWSPTTQAHASNNNMRITHTHPPRPPRPYNNHRMAFAASRMLKRGLTSFKGAARASTPAAFCK